MNRNCPNCAAPYDIGEVKCPFCGTLYLDLSCIDFDAHKPVFLKLRMGGNVFVTKAIPTAGSINVERETTSMYGGLGNTLLYTVHNGWDTTIDITFTGVNT